MRLESWKINSSIAMINIGSLLRASAILKPLFSQAETVSFFAADILFQRANNSLGKQKIIDQIAQLKYKDPNSQKIVVLEQELVRAEAESLVAEAQLSNITREKVKAAFTYQFDALREHCEKLAVIAGYGKHLIELIDDTPVTPGETRAAYDGYDASRAIIQDCEDALTNWVSSNAAVNSKLSTRATNLSQRRRNNISKTRGDGVDLASQDQPMRDDRDSWVPADQHPNYSQSQGEGESEDLYEGDDVQYQQGGESSTREEELTPVIA